MCYGAKETRREEREKGEERASGGERGRRNRGGGELCVRVREEKSERRKEKKR
jgi:hypothetical protein